MSVIYPLDTATGIDTTCKSNPRGNIHCYHIVEDLTDFREMCCWEGHLKPRATIPSHGSYAPQDSTST